jgi:ABC-type sugar transport system ATPase subunit
LAIRPEHVKLSPGNGSSSGLQGKIASKNYLGDAALIEIEVNGVTLMAKLAGDTELAVGERTTIELPADRWHVFSE